MRRLFRNYSWLLFFWTWEFPSSSQISPGGGKERDISRTNCGLCKVLRHKTDKVAPFGFFWRLNIHQTCTRLQAFEFLSKPFQPVYVDVFVPVYYYFPNVNIGR